MLGLTSAKQAKSTEKLSSGYKVNRAADDASGLAMSEKMRRQVRGLTQASANAQFLS
jgi:flagellin